MIKVTDVARDKLKEALNEYPGKYLRIVIEGYGWGTPRLGLALDEPNGDEKPTQVNGLDFLIGDEVKMFADRSSLDYMSSPYEGFIIRPGYSSC